MKHLGDITKISGYTAPVVDVITGGSPCQDMSVAGNRAGLSGERSGLFMEQIRIVKEMRERDRANGRTAWSIKSLWMKPHKRIEIPTEGRDVESVPVFSHKKRRKFTDKRGKSVHNTW